MKQLTQVQHSNQAVHKHLNLRPEVQLEMTLVQDHHTNLHGQIQASQSRAEGDPEEGRTSQVSIAACTSIQEPLSVPDLEEMSSSGLTSRHLVGGQNLTTTTPLKDSFHLMGPNCLFCAITDDQHQQGNCYG
ncbi:hypothetical protein F2P81_007496 [Scophthalmus maximus]|uniref:Uncharacterized protein n=1 Tax=Scophthalmus maximus TaxID=52904 RepID=A0A6A4T868_SCOMX|nr:hypothetical protein F2P81_007496 [Scophthalmus maximus]